MTLGYNGKILRVDLSTNTIAEETPAELVYRTYMGGSALSLYFLLKEQKAGVDPLGLENKLVFMSSVISGAPLPGLTRYTAASRSPLTGAFGEAEAGGFWGPELKMAGIDGIIVEGRSPKPVYLWIKDGKGEIRDAAQLWGKETGEVERLIREELGDVRIRVAQCGPAGEKTDDRGYFETLIASRKAAETTVDMVHMKALWTSLNMHAVMHDGKFPAALKDLGNPVLLKAPGKTGQPYKYIAGQTSSVPKANILVYEAKPVHRDGKCMVLRANGVVELVTPDQLKQAVAKTQEGL